MYNFVVLTLNQKYGNQGIHSKQDSNSDYKSIRHARRRFSFFDKDSDGKLKKSEIVKLLKEAEINGFIRGFVGSKLIEGYDQSGDELIDWEEFKAAVDKIDAA